MPHCEVLFPWQVNVSSDDFFFNVFNTFNHII